MYGKLFRDKRLKRGLSQDELAKISDIPRLTILRIENDEQEPKLTQALKLMRVLNIAPYELEETERVK